MPWVRIDGDELRVDDARRHLLADLDELLAALHEHLALRAQNAALEASMPLRDYLPVDYVPPEPALEPPPRPRRREWFDLDDAASAKWAA